MIKTNPIPLGALTQAAEFVYGPRVQQLLARHQSISPAFRQMCLGRIKKHNPLLHKLISKADHDCGGTK